MKLNIVLLIGLIFLISLVNARPAEEEYNNEYEQEAEAPPPKKAPSRGGLLNRRNPLSGRNAKTSTTTTTEAAPVEEVAEEGDNLEEEQIDAASSTTEKPKNFIKAQVRPFRSNDELLASLKRRREQAVSNKAQAKQLQSESSETHIEKEPAPSAVKPKPSNNGRRRFNGAKNTATKDNEAVSEEASSAAPARTARKYGRS